MTPKLTPKLTLVQWSAQEYCTLIERNDRIIAYLPPLNAADYLARRLELFSLSDYTVSVSGTINCELIPKP